MLKNTQVLFILFFILSSAFIARPRKIIGYWEVVKLEKENGGVEDTRERFIQFYDDGTIEAGNINYEPTKIGAWTLDKKEKVLTFNSKTKTNSDGDYEILILKRKEMVLKKGPITIHLEEVKKK
jgi:hypothetical protein